MKVIYSVIIKIV